MMKVAIIVFSPSGHTLEVAKMMERSMTNNGMKVQLLDITGNEKSLKKIGWNNILKRR